MSYTKKETDFWGNEKEVHYDDYGNKTGETHYRETFFGDKVQDHYDNDGEKVGETRKEEGFFSDRAVHYNSDGDKVGYTKDDSTFFGDKIQKHYDSDGNEIGRSHYEDRIFSGKVKAHKGKYFKSDTHRSSHSTSSYSSSSSDSIGFFGGVVILGLIVFGFMYFSQSSTNITKSPEVTGSKQEQNGISEAQKRYAVYQNIARNQDTNRVDHILKQDTVILLGMITDISESDGSGGFWHFDFEASNNNVQYSSFMCNSQSEVYLRLGDKNIKEDDIRRMQYKHKKVTLYIRSDEWNFVQNCTRGRCDVNTCPLGIVFSDAKS